MSARYLPYVALTLASALALYSVFGQPSTHSETALTELAGPNTGSTELLGDELASSLWQSLRTAPGGIGQGAFAPFHTAVIFVDYRCPYCTALEQETATLLDTHKDLRVVWRPWPILGDASKRFAREVLSAKPDQQLRLHEQMYMHPALADDHGGNELAIDLIQSNSTLAATLGLQGVPSIVIDGRPYYGELDGQAISEALIKSSGDPLRQ